MIPADGDHSEYVDAYCHIGEPRFGSLEQALFMFEYASIRQAVLVLGPGIPAYATLLRALALYPERLRGIGIVCGKPEARRTEIAELLLRAGVMGLRMEPQEIEQDAPVLALLGTTGRWVFAVGVAEPSRIDTLATLLEWLARHPLGRIAAPHFLRPSPIDEKTDSGRLLTELIRHPRFFPIFSRHGGVGSLMPYPHQDLAPWVSQVIELAGPQKILWGSEFPVCYWRNETLRQCQRWLAALNLNLSASQVRNFLRDNSRGLFFTEPASVNAVVLPAWVRDEYNLSRTVPLLPHGVLNVSVGCYQKLFEGFLESLGPRPELQDVGARFSTYLEGLLEARKA